MNKKKQRCADSKTANFRTTVDQKAKPLTGKMERSYYKKSIYYICIQKFGHLLLNLEAWLFPQFLVAFIALFNCKILLKTYSKKKTIRTCC